MHKTACAKLGQPLKRDDREISVVIFFAEIRKNSFDAQNSKTRALTISETIIK
jgi:hypothetical protein